MQQTTLRALLLGLLARRLRRWANVLSAPAEPSRSEEAGLPPVAASPTPMTAGPPAESPSAPVPDPFPRLAAAAEGGPPEDWLQRHSSGPPAHWVERVRQRAPQLLGEDDSLPVFSVTEGGLLPPVPVLPPASTQPATLPPSPVRPLRLQQPETTGPTPAGAPPAASLTTAAESASAPHPVAQRQPSATARRASATARAFRLQPALPRQPASTARQSPALAAASAPETVLPERNTEAGPPPLPVRAETLRRAHRRTDHRRTEKTPRRQVARSLPETSSRSRRIWASREEGDEEKKRALTPEARMPPPPAAPLPRKEQARISSPVGVERGKQERQALREVRSAKTKAAAFWQRMEKLPRPGNPMPLETVAVRVPQPLRQPVPDSPAASWQVSERTAPAFPVAADHWPALPDSLASDFDNEAEARWREWQQERRLAQEQMGIIWSEWLF